MQLKSEIKIYGISVNTIRDVKARFSNNCLSQSVFP